MHCYKEGGIMVVAGIFLDDHSGLHVCTVTMQELWLLWDIGTRYLFRLSHHMLVLLGINSFYCMIMPDLTDQGLLINILRNQDLEQKKWTAKSLGLKPLEHLWHYLGWKMASLNPSLRSLNELEQALRHLRAFFPIPGSTT